MTKGTVRSEIRYKGRYWDSDNRYESTSEYKLVCAKEMEDDIIVRLEGVEPTTDPETTYYVSVEKSIDGAFALLLADPGTTWKFLYEGGSRRLKVRPA